jgi:recombinational DNA repair ATPase RecF
MKLTELKIQGFKGGEGTIPLSGLDVFTGPNGSGKTRILQAVQMTIAGAVPHAIEDRNIETIELFSRDGEEGMGLRLSVDDPNVQSASRVFGIVRASGKDSVKQSIFLNDNPIGTAEGEKKLAELFGVFPVMLDVHEFIRMSDAQRAQLIFQFAPVDEKKWNHKVIDGKLHASVQQHSDEHLVGIYTRVLATIGVNPLTEGIKLALEYLSKQASALKKDVKENQSASTGSVKSSQTDGKSSLRHVEDIQGDIDKTRKDRDALVGSIEQTKATKQAWERLTNEKNKLVVAIEAKRKEVNPDAIAEMQAKVGALELNLKSVTFDRTDIEEQAVFVNQMRKERDEAANVQRERQFALSSAHKRLDLLGSGKCPTCQQATDGVAAGINEEIKELSEAWQTSNNNLTASENVLREAEVVLRHLTEGYDKIVEAAKQVGDERNRLKNLVATAQGGLSYLTDMQKKLEELNNTGVDGEMINLDEASLQLQGLENSIRNLSAELEAKRDYDTKITLAKQTHIKAKQAEESLELVKALTEKLTEIRWQIVKDALEPIREEAAALFAVAGQKAVFDFQFKDRRGNECFRFGWRFAGEIYDTFVDFDSLSTAQQLFTLISLLGPLIHRGNPKLRILLLDNCEVVDVTNQEKLMKLLLAAKASCFDNVLIGSSLSIPEYPAGVEVHRL